jgi:hypothetical protein
MPETGAVSLIQLFGAGCFGVLIGWYVYYINRYRSGDVQLGDRSVAAFLLGCGHRRSGTGVGMLHRPLRRAAGRNGL